MTTNSIPQALKERTKLLNQIERARQLRNELSRAKFSTEEHIRALETERLEAYTRKARGIRSGQKDAERIEQEINESRRSIESTDAEIAGAERAEQQATAELAVLQARELMAFADDAEEYTAEAIAKLEKAKTAIHEAYVAWVEAETVWGPLRAAIYEMHKLRFEQAGFHLPDTELMNASIVPAWPLPRPDELFPVTRSPRPPALEPQQEDEDDV